MAERMTVNHDVTGSSPVRGAKRSKSSDLDFFIQADRLGISLNV